MSGAAAAPMRGRGSARALGEGAGVRRFLGRGVIWQPARLSAAEEGEAREVAPVVRDGLLPDLPGLPLAGGAGAVLVELQKAARRGRISGFGVEGGHRSAAGGRRRELLICRVERLRRLERALLQRVRTWVTAGGAEPGWGHSRRGRRAARRAL